MPLLLLLLLLLPLQPQLLLLQLLTRFFSRWYGAGGRVPGRSVSAVGGGEGEMAAPEEDVLVLRAGSGGLLGRLEERDEGSSGSSGAGSASLACASEAGKQQPPPPEQQQDQEQEERMDSRNCSGARIAITHGPVHSMRCGRRIQAHVAAVSEANDIVRVIGKLQSSAQFSEATSFPCAFRILRCSSASGVPAAEPDEEPSGLLDAPSSVLTGAEAGACGAGVAAEASMGPPEGSPAVDSSASIGLERRIEEDHTDGSLVGGGARILHLLQRWDVYNVGVVVTAWEDGCTRVAASPLSERHRLVVDCCKEVLERCFIESLGCKLANLDKSAVVEYLRRTCGGGVESEGTDFSSLSFVSSLATSNDVSALMRAGSLSLVTTLRHRREQQHGQRQPREQRNAREAASRAGLACTELKFCGVKLCAGGANNQPGENEAFSAGADAGAGPGAAAGPGAPLFGGALRDAPRGHFLYGRQQLPRRPPKGLRSGEPCLRIVTKAPGFTVEEVRQLRAATRPHPDLIKIFAVVGMLLGAAETDWLSLRPLFRSSDLPKRMSEIVVTKEMAHALEAFVETHFSSAAARSAAFKASTAAGKALDWLLAVASCTATYSPRHEETVLAEPAAERAQQQQNQKEQQGQQQQRRRRWRQKEQQGQQEQGQEQEQQQQQQQQQQEHSAAARAPPCKLPGVEEVKRSRAEMAWRRANSGTPPSPTGAGPEAQLW